MLTVLLVIDIGRKLADVAQHVSARTVYITESDSRRLTRARRISKQFLNDASCGGELGLLRIT